ncbi:MAG: DUF2807 domain-containing protein [Bacteroidia bacterium]|nr:DUF2807 domain-containing protein [Bacteroidia bacterium]
MKRLFIATVLLLVVQPFTLMAQTTDPVLVSRDIDIANINSFHLSGWAEVVIMPGTPRMVITGTEEDLARIHEQRDGSSIKLWEEEVDNDGSSVPSRSTPQVLIYCSGIKELSANGLAQLQLAEGLLLSTLTLTIDGVAQADIHLEVNKIQARISGVANLSLSGKTDSGLINVSGIGRYDARSFDRGQAILQASGIASAR